MNPAALGLGILPESGCTGLTLLVFSAQTGNLSQSLLLLVPEPDVPGHFLVPLDLDPCHFGFQEGVTK